MTNTKTLTYNSIGVDQTGVDETGVDETGVDETGVDEKGVDEASSRRKRSRRTRYTPSKRAFVTNFAQCTRKLHDCCVQPGMRLQYIAGLSSFQKPRKPPRYAIGPCFASEMCSASTFFHLWEWSKFFQREFIFCSKISSGGPYYFIKKLVRGEPILRGPFLPRHISSLLHNSIRRQRATTCMQTSVCTQLK